MKTVLDTLITDRTQKDVDRVAEVKQKMKDGTATAADISEYLSGAMKGAYNASDLNRVDEAVQYLAEKITDLGYPVSIPKREVWKETDWITKSKLDRYLSDISTLGSTIKLFSWTPKVTSMDKMTFKTANDIEKILLCIKFAIDKIIGSYRKCGQFTAFCGGHILPVQGAMVPRTWEELDYLGWGWDIWDTLTWYELLYEEVPE